MDKEDKRYRVVVRDSSAVYASNALTYDSIDKAIAAGQSLYARWTACRSYAVIDTDVPRDVDGIYWTADTVILHCVHCGGE